MLELEPIRVEWRWQTRPFRAHFTHGGTKVGVCRWTPWTARERAERLQDRIVERAIQSAIEERADAVRLGLRRDYDREFWDAMKVIGYTRPET